MDKKVKQHSLPKLVNFLTQPISAQIATLEWRNSPQVARWFQIKNISLDVHKKWCEALKITPPRTIAFFIEYDASFIGVTYFSSVDWSAKSADWGIYVYSESLRGCGIGSEVLRQSLDYAKKIMGMDMIFLEVLSCNTSAIQMYERVGFTLLHEKQDGIKRYFYDLS